MSVKVNAGFLKAIGFAADQKDPARAFFWISTPEGPDFWDDESHRHYGMRKLPGRSGMSSKALRIMRRWRAAYRKFSIKEGGQP